MAKNLLTVAVLISMQLFTTAQASKRNIADFRLIDIVEHNRTLSTIGIIPNETELKRVASKVSVNHLNVVGTKLKGSFQQKLESAKEWYRQYFLIRSLSYKNDLAPATVGDKTNILQKLEGNETLNMGSAMNYIFNKRNAEWHLPTRHLLVYEIAQDILLRLGGNFDGADFIPGVGPLVNDDHSTMEYKKAVYVWEQLNEINQALLEVITRDKYVDIFNKDLLDLIKNIDHQLSKIKPKQNETFLLTGKSRFTAIHLTHMAYIKMATKITSSIRRIFYHKLKSQSVYAKALNASFQTLDFDGASSEMIVNALLSSTIQIKSQNDTFIAKGLFEDLQSIFKIILPPNDAEFLNSIPTTHFEHYKIMGKNIKMLLNTPLVTENHVLSGKILEWLFLTTYMGDKKNIYEEQVLEFLTRFSHLAEYNYILIKGLDLFIQMKSEHRGTSEKAKLHFENMNQFLTLVEHWKNNDIEKEPSKVIDELHKALFHDKGTRFEELIRYSKMKQDQLVDIGVYGSLDRMQTFVNFVKFYIKNNAHLFNESKFNNKLIEFLGKIEVFSKDIRKTYQVNESPIQKYLSKILLHLSIIINRTDITDITRTQYMYLLHESLWTPEKLDEYVEKFSPTSSLVAPLNSEVIDEERTNLKGHKKFDPKSLSHSNLDNTAKCEILYIEN